MCGHVALFDVEMSVAWSSAVKAQSSAMGNSGKNEMEVLERLVCILAATVSLSDSSLCESQSVGNECVFVCVRARVCVCVCVCVCARARVHPHFWSKLRNRYQIDQSGFCPPW